MVFVEGDDYRQLRRPGGDPAQFRSVVRPAQVPAAPDSVVHQYLGKNFTTSTWPDTAPSGPQADMTVNGPVTDTLNGDPAATSDGIDDFGLADGPQDTFSSQNCAVAFVFNADGSGVFNTTFFGAKDSSSRFRIGDNDRITADGTIDLLAFDNNGNELIMSTKNIFVDSKTHLAVINIDFSKGASGIEFYVDDMSSPVPTTVFSDTGFSISNQSLSTRMGFYALNTPNGVTAHKPYTSRFFEFNSERYTPSDRDEITDRIEGI
jgi:hypothetical protein